MAKCSNYAHDKALMGGVAIPEPDELLADIMALETWRGQIEKRSADTIKKRKARPAAIQTTARSEERRVGKECVSSVDLGGRRIIKNKTKTNNEHQQSDKQENNKNT